MLQTIFDQLTQNHRRFRHIQFDELEGLYTSMMMRTFAISMAGIFIPIYLYQLDYPVWQIMLFYAVSYSTQYILVQPIASLVAYFGPKRIIAVGFVILSCFLIGTSFLGAIPSSGVWILAALFGAANVSFFVPFNVGFSKHKNTKTSGKEVGTTYIMERIGTVSGPLIGGLIAYILEPRYIFLVSVVLLIGAAIPLLASIETIKTKQKLRFKDFKLPGIKYDMTSYAAMTVDTAMTVILWPLFLGIIVFRDSPYVQLGVITSAAVLISIASARVIGKLVDTQRGRQLLRLSTCVKLVLNICRPFTNGFVMALSINIVKEVATPGMRMPFMKGMYDAADGHPGFRIVYIASLEKAGIGARIMFFSFASLTAYFMTTGRLYFFIIFAIGALFSLFILVERFKALDPQKPLLSPQKLARLARKIIATS